MTIVIRPVVVLVGLVFPDAVPAGFGFVGGAVPPAAVPPPLVDGAVVPVVVV